MPRILLVQEGGGRGGVCACRVGVQGVREVGGHIELPRIGLIPDVQRATAFDSQSGHIKAVPG